MVGLISKNNFKKKAFFLDRDGILNKLVENRPPWKISEISLFKEAHEIIKIIKSKNYLPIVVTNQPDEARGKLLINTDSINQNICLSRIPCNSEHIIEYAGIRNRYKNPSRQSRGIWNWIF